MTIRPSTHTTGTTRAAVRLAREVQARVQDSEPLASGDLFALASGAYGGTLAEGAFTPRDAYDAAELGLHLHLLHTVGRLPSAPADARDALAEVERLSALLPSQTRRTAEQNDFQQFSTPAAYAGLCAWVSGVGEGHRVLEPSAGTGALCTFALASGAALHANELSDRRADLLAALLRESGQDPARALTRENADHLDAILPPEARADVVLMNPPFSQTAGRLGSRRVPTVGTDHVLQALRRLDAGGRLVAVLSAAVQRGKPTHRAFFEAVDADPFSLRADIEVSGAVYRPYGTSVRTRLLVVDRAPKTSSGGGRGRVEAAAEGVADALGALAPVRESVGWGGAPDGAGRLPLRHP
ncbi:MAG: class I SAM-dependent methyltransferase [Bacteroidota bacterium]